MKNRPLSANQKKIDDRNLQKDVEKLEDIISWSDSGGDEDEEVLDSNTYFLLTNFIFFIQ